MKRFVTESVTVSGWIAGRLWWPVGAPATQHRTASINPNASSIRAQRDPYPTLRDALVGMLESASGDLSSVGFLPDTLCITVCRHRLSKGQTVETRTRSRMVRGKCWETDDVFASADLVCAVEEAEAEDFETADYE